MRCAYSRRWRAGTGREQPPPPRPGASAEPEAHLPPELVARVSRWPLAPDPVGAEEREKGEGGERWARLAEEGGKIGREGGE